MRAGCAPMLAVNENKPYVGKRALLVEPDTKLRAVLRARLNTLGISSEECACGVEAVVAARSQTPEVILLDYQLRDVNGYELVRWLHSNPKLAGVPIIVMNAPLRDREALGAEGIRLFLALPAPEGGIETAVKTALHPIREGRRNRETAPKP